jgi:hypothetical protein
VFERAVVERAVGVIARNGIRLFSMRVFLSLRRIFRVDVIDSGPASAGDGPASAGDGSSSGLLFAARTRASILNFAR